MTKIKSFSDLGVAEPKILSFIGDKISVKKILDKEITVFHYKIVDSKFTDKGNGKCLNMQIEFNGEKRLVRTGSIFLQETIKLVPEHNFPFTTIIKEIDERYKFN